MPHWPSAMLRYLSRALRKSIARTVGLYSGITTFVRIRLFLMVALSHSLRLVFELAAASDAAAWHCWWMGRKAVTVDAMGTLVSLMGRILVHVPQNFSLVTEPASNAFSGPPRRSLAPSTAPRSAVKGCMYP
eukprot:scaffold213_cov245-Pinguiococcus_pyrenoidosus.AAC.5